MRLENGAMRLSASDLMRFTGCGHATAFDVEQAHGRGPKPDGDGAETAILQRKGLEHEARELAKLIASGQRVVELPSGGSIAAMAPGLLEILRDGPDVVYQASLNGSLDGTALWGGRSDFLHRVERPSALGSFSYEVADTKLKREVAPSHVLQLTVYSDLLAEVQGAAPAHARVVLGTGEARTIRLDDYGAYARRLRRRLEAFVNSPRPTRSQPCAECAICRWASRCGADWTATDSLFGVANITRGQVTKLEAAGISTLAALSAHGDRVPGMADPTLEKVVRQARLQQARKTGEPHFELCPPVAGRGFALLPEPDPDDVFYDIEGDPYHPDGGLEYLHGVQHRGTFTAFWAHDREAEAEALRRLFTFWEERLIGRPGAHIYHYAAYEVTALRRLVQRHRVGEVFFDRLLRERRFVDLYTVVRGALVASEENYSIKSIERLYYGGARTGDVTTSMGSVVAYHEWLDTHVQKILDDIEAYNAIDCDSTEKLRDWLVEEVRPDGQPWPVIRGEADEASLRQQEEIDEVRALVAAVPEPDRRETLVDLGLFHRREDKPAWWAVFDSLAKDGEDLLDDLDALGGLVALGPAELAPTKRSLDRRYAFPLQETKLRADSEVTISVEGALKTLKVVAIDRKAGEVTLRAGKANSHWLADEMSLHPNTPFDNKSVRAALRAVLADQANGRELTAIDDLLARRPPRLATGATDDILGTRDPVEGTVAAVLALEGGVLPVQGPPGTGKTYVSARAILALVAKGLRVGVCAHSHEAIRNLLEGCVQAARSSGASSTLTIAHRGSNDSIYDPAVPVQWVTDPKGAELGHAEIVGGTVWHFSRDDQVGAFHALVVDEAGQMSLANLMAMGRAARSLVLVGDPRQLPQVIQGVHPGSAGLSCLDWILGEEATMPRDRGIFLGVSRRMHPAVCAFVSERSYEGRLASHPSTERQAIDGTPWPAAGAHWIPVAHAGRSQVSEEEVDAIVATARDLLGGCWTDRDGRTRPMTPRDVIVVAPYNAQVNELRDALDVADLVDVRVGTVDKFQGQEAAAALVSMTTSSAEESPRGMEFLLSLNRINVAISRAKALALVFGSERLLDAACRTLEQMRLANTLCALAERSSLVR